jgi:hypothetical protein
MDRIKGDSYLSSIVECTHFSQIKSMKKFKKSELVIMTLVIILIGISEYYFVITKEPLKAIFIGLWCPTILGFLILFNMKK